MWVQIICAVLSGAAAVALTLFFAYKDVELPKPKTGLIVVMGVLTTLLSLTLAMRLDKDLPVLMGIFMAYLVFVTYTDATIHKVYTLVNVLVLVGVAIYYGWSHWGQFDWILIVLSAIFLGLGLVGAYGRGDGYALAAIALCIGCSCRDSNRGIFFTIIIGCGCFVLYSLADYLYNRLRKVSGRQVRFWKEKRPLLPSMGIGMIAGMMLVG